MKAALSDRYIKGMDAAEFVEGRERRTVWDDTQTGLGLVVHRSGTKSWVLRYSLRGRISSVTLGQWPDVPYAQAKAKAQKLRGGMADGVSPARVKKDGLTVADLIERFEDDYIPGLAESTSKTYKQILRYHVAPVIGRMPLEEVGLTEAARCRCA